jgi:hypothetical protein
MAIAPYTSIMPSHMHTVSARAQWLFTLAYAREFGFYLNPTCGAL